MHVSMDASYRLPLFKALNVHIGICSTAILSNTVHTVYDYISTVMWTSTVFENTKYPLHYLQMPAIDPSVN